MTPLPDRKRRWWFYLLAAVVVIISLLGLMKSPQQPARSVMGFVAL